jgi:hypothetical protein
MRYKLDTGHGRATLLDRRRVMAKGLDIVDAERMVEALNLRDVTARRLDRARALYDASYKAVHDLYKMRLVPRYSPEPDDHVL